VSATQRIAVVTGASSGIGEALARTLTARGWRCILLARREDRLQALAEELGAEWERCDVSDKEEVDAVAARILERHLGIALLVNNAGQPGRTGFLNGDPERIEAVMRVNYLGSVWCLRAFLPALEAYGRADVINIVSVAGTMDWAASGPYSASKHAQLTFSRSVTAELTPRGIRVHTINPGFVESEGFPQRGKIPRWLTPLVIDPPDVAAHVMRALDHDRRETFVPAIYRIVPIVQMLAPGLVARVQARRMAARNAK
jgi:short-subunit dehydrogenase